MKYPRAILPLFQKRLRPNKVVLLIGPRRVGKTVFIKNFVNGLSIDKCLILNGDDVLDMALLKERSVPNYKRLLEGKEYLIIDEAQALPDDTLEALRLLTNLETEQRKLLQVVLFGQPELDKRLASYKFRQLRQRVSFSYFLRGMSYYEVQAYVSARIDIAGVRQPLFSPGALKAIWKYSRGIPRLVNVLSHKGLMLAFGENKLQVDTKHLRYAAKDTEDVQIQMSALNPIFLGVLISVLLIAAAAAWHFRGLWL